MANNLVASTPLNGCSSNSKEEVTRPLAHFHPNIWGDRFLSYIPPPQETQLKWRQELERLKEEVRKKLVAVGGDPKERIIYIDAIEQLGVAYHFEEEIEAILQQFYDKYNEHDYLYNDDLHYVALRFRILRQHGFVVSSDDFERFKSEDGSFKESTPIDVQGILNLYEASHLRVHGEKILDEAMEFTTSQLKSLVGKLSEPLATQVTQALKLPLHSGGTRLLSRCYIHNYASNPSHDKILLRFAKIDFNLLQSMHLEELQDLSRWWKSLHVSTELPYARDRLVEAYFWVLGVFHEPQYALGRAIFTKIYKIISILDDTYDAYGLFDELELFTEAVQRWDKSCSNKLPDYMKLVYKYLLDTFDECERDLAKEGTSHFVPYVRDMMKAGCQAYFREAKWLHEKYIPTYDEYMETANVTLGYSLLTGVAFLGMGRLATDEAFQWASQTVGLIKNACIIGRLISDIASHKSERKRNHIASAVECYMAQYGVSEEKATVELYKEVEEAWKNLNKDMFRPTKFSRPLQILVINLTRVLEVFYRLGDDEYSVVNQNAQDKIKAILIDPVPL